MSRKQPKRTAGRFALSAIAGLFVLAALMGGMSLSVASAGSADELARAGAFGYDLTTTNATKIHSDQDTTVPAPQDTAPALADGVGVEQSVLARTTTRDLTNGFAMIDAMEQAERERIQRENVAVFDRIAATKAINGVTTNISPDPAKNMADTEYGLPAVDWTVGMEAFLDEWTARIDAYLAGSALEGYGRVFAEAAWDNGVDPRFSPAISCVESGKAASCFRTCNAWGWGGMNFPDWDTAIRTHIKGLAEGYGYSVTLEGATMYNYEMPEAWRSKVQSEMATI